MVTHDVALWNGNDTEPAVRRRRRSTWVRSHQIVAGGNTTTIGTSASIVDGIKSAVAQMVANNGYHVRPTAIYANPVLLDLIDREMKTEFNVVLDSDQITGGLPREDALDAGGRSASHSGLEPRLHRHSGFGIGSACPPTSSPKT